MRNAYSGIGATALAIVALGAAFLIGFFFYIRARERAGKEPLLSTGLFRNRTCNLALVTQNIQWLLLMGASFVVSVFLQTVRGYNAIETGVIFTAATLGAIALLRRELDARDVPVIGVNGREAEGSRGRRSGEGRPGHPAAKRPG